MNHGTIPGNVLAEYTNTKIFELPRQKKGNIAFSMIPRKIPPEMAKIGNVGT